LIGTKKDLCYENLPAGHRANQRSVPFTRAEELCKKLRLAGCVETSNQWPHRYGYQNKEFFWEDINDTIGQAACLCVDQTNRELLMEYSLMPQDGNMT